jgi:hypothetical protein
MVGLFEPSYTVRLLFISGSGTTQFDNIGLISQVPTESRSWGMIKNLYR